MIVVLIHLTTTKKTLRCTWHPLGELIKSTCSDHRTVGNDNSTRPIEGAAVPMETVLPSASISATDLAILTVAIQLSVL